MTSVCTAALLSTKPSPDHDSGFRHGFGIEASLSVTHNATAVANDTTRLCRIIVTIHAFQRAAEQ